MRILILFDLLSRPAPDETFSASSLQRQDKPTEADLLGCLQRLGHEVDAMAVFDDVPALVEKLKTTTPDVVFNMTEAVYRDRAHEPNIPALFQLMKVRYTGAGPEALLLCKDKALAKQILAYHRVRVARFVVSHKARPLRRLRRFIYPAFVKPIAEEASDGISRSSFAKDEADALERVRFIHESFQSDALIEEYIEGRELFLSVLGKKRPMVFPPRELFFEQVPEDVPRFATYKAKWDEAYRKRWGIRNGPAAPLPEGMAAKLDRLARRVHRVLKIDGPLRVDVRLTPAGEVVVLEANPNPSLAREEDYAQAAAAAGIEYEQLIQKIIDAALARD